jgi:hypothetical protein
MRYLVTVRSAPKDGGTLEYVFEADAAEIAADFMTTFYHVQVGALETQEFRTTPAPFWLVCFSDTIKGPMRQTSFVVLLPDGTVVCRGWRNGCSLISIEFAEIG